MSIWRFRETMTGCSFKACGSTGRKPHWRPARRASLRTGRSRPARSWRLSEILPRFSRACWPGAIRPSLAVRTLRIPARTFTLCPSHPAPLGKDACGHFRAVSGPGPPEGHNTYLHAVDDIFVTDAYHSLSIEGYRVSRDLIERVRSGEWHPENNEADPAARIVLGHFIFVYIHPYFDGNGRMGRFLMNVMMAAGGISVDGNPR